MSFKASSAKEKDNTEPNQELGRKPTNAPGFEPFNLRCSSSNKAGLRVKFYFPLLIDKLRV